MLAALWVRLWITAKEVEWYVSACVQDEVAYFSLPFSFDLLYVGAVDQTEGSTEVLQQSFTQSYCASFFFSIQFYSYTCL